MKSKQRVNAKVVDTIAGISHLRPAGLLVSYVRSKILI